MHADQTVDPFPFFLVDVVDRGSIPKGSRVNPNVAKGARFPLRLYLKYQGEGRALLVSRNGDLFLLGGVMS
jgi:hypothetical protein